MVDKEDEYIELMDNLNPTQLDNVFCERFGMEKKEELLIEEFENSDDEQQKELINILKEIKQ